jgi:hypothetical protein
MMSRLYPVRRRLSSGQAIGYGELPALIGQLTTD